MFKKHDLTKGNITAGLWFFAIPLILGNLLQQLYNLTDTWIVGKYIGTNGLAAVGSSYALMTFLTSIVIGLSLGCSTYISMACGRQSDKDIRGGIYMSALFTGSLAILITALIYILSEQILRLLQIPGEIHDDMLTYLTWVFVGFFAVFIYNYIANIMRGLGDSASPLIFLALSVTLNIAFDLLFVAVFRLGIMGAAIATALAQWIAALALLLYFIRKYRQYLPRREDRAFDSRKLKQILSLSGFTCLQQSVMNFGILTVQGIVNGFGATVMAAFAIAVKIDTIAYMPVQDFGNAFSVFAAQNYGAGLRDRIDRGVKTAFLNAAVFSLIVSLFVCLLAGPLMGIFTDAAPVISQGILYLRIEGAFYIGIGTLFLLYGYFRAVNRPMVSVILTVISLGTRVLLAATLSRIDTIGVKGIWAAIPVGWFLADAAGLWLMYKSRKKRTPSF